MLWPIVGLNSNSIQFIFVVLEKINYWNMLVEFKFTQIWAPAGQLPIALEGYSRR